MAETYNYDRDGFKIKVAEATSPDLILIIIVAPVVTVTTLGATYFGVRRHIKKKKSTAPDYFSEIFKSK